MATVDILASIDDAIKDGVDVLSASFGEDFKNLAEVHEDLALGAFHAVIHGIPVIAPGEILGLTLTQSSMLLHG